MVLMKDEVAVFEWLVGDDKVGVGTLCEFDHWAAQGTMDGVALGRIVWFEDPAEDARRRAAWGVN